jgi:tetratricopeptide (TPR) repeat protein
MDLGEPEAEALFRDAAAAFAARGDGVGETYARINRTRLLAGADRLGEALEEAASARRAAASGEPGLLQEVRMLELRLRYLAGGERVELQRALEALEAELTEASGYGLRRDVTAYLAATAYDLGEYRRALEHYEAAARAARAAGDTPTVATVELNALHVVLAQRAHDAWGEEARARATRALESAVAAGVPDVEASARLTLGRLTQGAPGEALLEEGLAIARRLGAADLERDALGYLALRTLSDPRRALELVAASREAALRTGDPLGPAAAWHEQLAVLWALEGRDAALERAEEILAARAHGAGRRRGLCARLPGGHAPDRSRRPEGPHRRVPDRARAGRVRPRS